MAWLVDGEDYFRAFREAAGQARQSLLILGWDQHSQFELVRLDPEDGAPTALAPFLDRLAREKPDLQIHVLGWDYAMLLAPDREWSARIRLGWNTHDRLHFELDDHHPVGSSHHQKVVVIDDRLAFAGGLDLTLGRWDTREHRANESRRADLGHPVPQPYHDVQMAVSGPVAAVLGDLARERWRLATGERLSPPESGDGTPVPWPASVEPDLTGVTVGVARTLPACGEQAETREVESVLLEAIAQARQWLYIENQYFTAEGIGQALATRLAEDDGPEVVLVLPERTDGWLSQYTMDVLRVRELERLQKADRHGRLRLYFPVTPGLGEVCINVHAKVLVADDRALTVGSANLNNRSLGLDSECNLVIDAGDDTRLRQGVARLRDRLLAEHMGTSPGAVGAAVQACGSLVEAVESLNTGERRLLPLPVERNAELDALAPDTELADPGQAVDLDYLSRLLLAPQDRGAARKALFAFCALLVLAVLLAAAWRWTPLGDWIDLPALFERLAAMRGGWLAPLLVSVAFVVGGLLVVPVTLLIVATGLAFGAAWGFAYAMLGSLLSAIAGYGLGHWLGHDLVRRLPHRWLNRVSRYLGRQGLLAIITLRIVPVAPFTVINLLVGASHMRLRQFVPGTVIGLVPGVLGLTLLSDQIAGAVREPDLTQVALVAGLAALLAISGWLLARWFRNRERQRN